MGRTFSDSSGPGLDPALARALERLDALVDWERRDRAGGTGRDMRVDLAPIADLTQRLGRPQAGLPAVHVAGSKGKGSTAAWIASGLQHAGLRVGLYTSPHVERLTERVRLDGSEVSEAALAQALDEALGARDSALEAGTPAARATWFDVLTAAALWRFRADRADAIVVECGLGGRLDSTNAIEPRLCVLTTLALEHTAILGSTLPAIAAEKAGILAPGVPAVAAWARADGAAGQGRSGEEGPAAAAVLRHAADLLGVSLVDVPGARVGTLGERNRALAAAALDRLGAGAAGWRAPEGRPVGGWILDNEPRGRSSLLPGRLELRWSGATPVVLDGAHVPASLEAVLDELAGRTSLQGRPVAVFGCGSDKDARGLLKALGRRVDRTLCTSVDAGPSALPTELVRLARELGLEASRASDPGRAFQDALRLARERRSWVLVTGSLHLVGALRSATRATPC